MEEKTLSFYQTIFEHTCEGLVIVNDRGIIELANPRLLELFGYESKEDLVGKTIEVLIPKRYHKNHVGQRDGFIKKPDNRPMGIGKELRGVKKDGTEFPVEISLSPFNDGQGTRKTIGFVSDISERAQIQSRLKEINTELENIVEKRSIELRRSNQLYQSIAENFPNGCIYIFDQNYNYLFAEGKELKNRGLKGAELIGHNYMNLLDPKLKDVVKSNLSRVLKGEEVSFELDYQGAIFNIQGVPLVNEQDNTIDRILVVESDITEEKSIQKEIEKSLEKEKELNQLKSRFITLVSHEFRTPLSAIKSSAQIIDHYQKETEKGKRQKHTARIENSVNHLNQMIEDILSLSKIEEGVTEVKLENVSLNEVLRNVLSDCSEMFPNKILSSENEAITFETDPKLLKHVLQNVIGNAFKYTPDGKKIKITTKNAGNEIVIIIEDEGIGIPKDDQQNLFERFHRATNVANIKGTGLGLNIVKKYIEELKGKITFESTENKGTTFVITFPKELKDE